MKSSDLIYLSDIVLDNIGEAIAVIDTSDYSILDANSSFINQCGLPEKEVIGKTCYNVTHLRIAPCKAPNDICPLVETLSTKKPAKEEHIHLTSSGEQRYVEVTTIPLLNDEGNCDKAIHISRDITAQRLAEQSLRQSEQNFRNSLDNSPLGVIIIGEKKKPSDVTGEIVYANKAILNFYGFDSVEELRSSKLTERYSPKTIEEIAERMKLRDAGHSMPDYYEVEIRRKNGETRVLAVSTARVVWHSEIHDQLVYLDITERKRAQAAREQAIKELTEALTKVETLSGLLPICAWCKKMRDDTGYWQEVEAYLENHTKAEFTHSICPDCAGKYFSH